MIVRLLSAAMRLSSSSGNIKGGAVKSGTSIIVKDGEVAVLVGSSQTTIEGLANTTASEDLSEVFSSTLLAVT